MKIFLDDIRQSYDDSWTVVRDYEEFVDLVKLVQPGLITHISFDHDLGSEVGKTGYDAAKWFVDQCIRDQRIGQNLDQVIVHSANPVGRENISAYFENAAKHGILNQNLTVT